MRKFTVSALCPAAPQNLPGSDPVKEMISHWQTQLDKVLPDQPDLIVTPECANRFPAMSMEDRLEYYAYENNAVREFFQKQAADNHCMIAYSAVRVLPDGTRRNSTVLIDRRGEIAAIYDKNFPMMAETQLQNIQPGAKEVVVDTELGRIGFAICFDLNFASLRQRYAARHPQLMLFCSMYHGGLNQSIWAYQCQSYFVGTCGDKEDHEATIIDPQGTQIARSTEYHHYLTREINTDYELIHLDFHFDKLAAAKAKYGRKITISDPGHLGSVLLTSETPEVSAADIVAEFEMQVLSDYLQESEDFRNRQLQ